MNVILDNLKSVIATYAGVSAGDISNESTLEELDVDSIFTVELILEIEKHHGVRLSLDDIVNEDSLTDLADRIQKAASAVSA
ncbi:acyl carrier protein [Pseudoclavibacter sp. VKM Ac-2888]|uniref:acyl carrier protein n=1 Tax=Pseudoclavibacter sp. VKM Ac-2888 TaxID=2783830 RepID=UPI00188AC982|nr:acyl carrier protein [Pseudoclavibacter sp. VKM Ac-2888]MBF4549143.1 acyl carrier protein [Pseudoclavibacter sp. VKM Ac-2888]